MLLECASCPVSVSRYFQDCAFELWNILIVLKNLIVAGLVDAHTHPVWAGDRVHEFAMKVNDREQRGHFPWLT